MTLARNPKARAVMTPGTLYAVDGSEDWVYYGQVSPTKDIGFLKYRTREVADGPDILRQPMMCRVSVGYPSIGIALRAGKWQRLGLFPLHASLLGLYRYVQWPAFSREAIVWIDDGITAPQTFTTTIDDPDIQGLERAASWDAVHHIPARLKVEYGAELGEWHVGGPIWREREIEERRKGSTERILPD